MEGMFLSFVVPVYNAEKYLPQCLDSLLAQDIPGYEILCVKRMASKISILKPAFCKVKYTMHYVNT